MFKFESKIKDLYKFTNNITDLHTFSTKINDVHRLVTKCWDAIVVKRINIVERNKAVVFIGGQKIKLSSLAKKLKDLPITLRQFTGAYVYLRAKARFINMIGSTSSSFAKLRIKGRVSNITPVITIISAILKIKGTFIPNATESNVVMKFIRRMKSRFSDIVSHGISDLVTILQAKAKINEQIPTFQSCKNHILTKAKITNLTKLGISLSYYQGKRKKLISYGDDSLAELPTTLRGFCFDFANENWEDVRSTYATWNDIKTNVSTWDDLMK